MKILHIDETFHPNYGYHTNPLAKYQSMQGHEVIILTVEKNHLYPVYKDFGDDGSTLDEDDLEYTKSTGVPIIRMPAFGYIQGRLVYKPGLFQKIDEIKPDIIYAHCLETLTSISLLMRVKKYPIFFDSHMLAMASKNRFSKVFEFFFRNLISPKINKKRLIVFRTQDDNYVNSHLGIDKSLTPFISFGTDTMLFKPSEEARANFRHKYNISNDDFVVIYTGKLTEAKGGLILATAFKKKFEKPVVLICVGTPPNNEYGNYVKAEFSKSENRILLFPTQKYSDLASFYQAADLSVFPKQCSLSFYDAQACGLPVVSEDNNVNINRCSHSNGINFKAGNIEDFRSQIAYMMNMPKSEFKKLSESARSFVKSNYDYSFIAETYNHFFENSVNII